MEIVNFDLIGDNIIKAKIPKPLSGTLSGHAAGEPFDKYVFNEIKNHYSNTFRQYEYLNNLYLKNPSCENYEERSKLIKSKTLQYLLNRGKKSIENWKIENQFEEKQNDTADIIVYNEKTFEIIDVKTRNISKKAQPPNIISSYKLANTCGLIIDNKNESISIRYFGVDWELEDKYLVCKKIHDTNLFKAQPKDLYINWAAAMQVQFNVSDLDQNFQGSIEEWARLYIEHFVKGVHDRARYMENKFANPLLKYIK